MQINRVTLVYPGQVATETQKAVYLHLPLSSLCLAAYLRQRGYAIDVLDMRVGKYKKYDFSGTDVLGIGCMTGHQIKYGLGLAEQARSENPDLPIVWGGGYTRHFTPRKRLDIV